MLRLGMIIVVLMIAIVGSINKALAGDKELCMQSPYGGSVTLTVEACPVTTNTSFYRAFYTQTDGVEGEGCWVGDSSIVMIVWATHPVAYFPSTEFGSCDPDEALKSKLKQEGDML